MPIHLINLTIPYEQLSANLASMTALDDNFLIETESDKVLRRIITTTECCTKGWLTELLILFDTVIPNLANEGLSTTMYGNLDPIMGVNVFSE